MLFYQNKYQTLDFINNGYEFLMFDGLITMINFRYVLIDLRQLYIQV